MNRHGIQNVLLWVLVISCLGVCGCSDVYSEQRAEVSRYNDEVRCTIEDYGVSGEVARANSELVMNAVTYNGGDKALLSVLGVQNKTVESGSSEGGSSESGNGGILDRGRNESEEDWVYRNINSLIDGLENYEVYDEYLNFKMGVSTFENRSGEHIYKYGMPYIMSDGYYSTVSSNYLCQVLVVYFGNSSEHIVVRAYWDDGKLVRISI